MPSAVDDHSLIPSGITLRFSVMVPTGDNEIIVRISDATATEIGDRAVTAACQAAYITQTAMQALCASVADMTPTDPRHAAAYAAVELLQPTWQEQLTRVCTRPATTLQAMVTKAALLDLLIERDATDTVQGGRVHRLAATLSTDMLAFGP